MADAGKSLDWGQMRGWSSGMALWRVQDEDDKSVEVKVKAQVPVVAAPVEMEVKVPLRVTVPMQVLNSRGGDLLELGMTSS
jgi:hypothetical protein